MVISSQTIFAIMNWHVIAFSYSSFVLDINTEICMIRWILFTTFLCYYSSWYDARMDWKPFWVRKWEEMTTTRKKTTTIKLKSLKEPREESDGLRILIARSGFPYWLNVKTKRWDEWWKELAPSKSLWQDFVVEEKITWNQYRNDSYLKLEIILRQHRHWKCWSQDITMLLHFYGTVLMRDIVIDP